jgi:ribosomal protein L20
VPEKGALGVLLGVNRRGVAAARVDLLQDRRGRRRDFRVLWFRRILSGGSIRRRLQEEYWLQSHAVPCCATVVDRRAVWRYRSV